MIHHTTTTVSTLHNGPACGTCGARYIGQHTCSHADIVRRINELLGMLDTRPRLVDTRPTCPCRPENGGSGVCGCVLGGPRITC